MLLCFLEYEEYHEGDSYKCFARNVIAQSRDIHKIEYLPFYPEYLFLLESPLLSQGPEQPITPKPMSFSILILPGTLLQEGNSMIIWKRTVSLKDVSSQPWPRMNSQGLYRHLHSCPRGHSLRDTTRHDIHGLCHPTSRRECPGLSPVASWSFLMTQDGGNKCQSEPYTSLQLVSRLKKRKRKNIFLSQRMQPPLRRRTNPPPSTP